MSSPAHVRRPTCGDDGCQAAVKGARSEVGAMCVWSRATVPTRRRCRRRACRASPRRSRPRRGRRRRGSGRRRRRPTRGLGRPPGQRDHLSGSGWTQNLEGQGKSQVSGRAGRRARGSGSGPESAPRRWTWPTDACVAEDAHLLRVAVRRHRLHAAHVALRRRVDHRAQHAVALVLVHEHVQQPAWSWSTAAKTAGFGRVWLQGYGLSVGSEVTSRSSGERRAAPALQVPPDEPMAASCGATKTPL